MANRVNSLEAKVERLENTVDDMKLALRASLASTLKLGTSAGAAPAHTHMHAQGGYGGSAAAGAQAFAQAPTHIPPHAHGQSRGGAPPAAGHYGGEKLAIVGGWAAQYCFYRYPLILTSSIFTCTCTHTCTGNMSPMGSGAPAFTFSNTDMDARF